MKCPFCNYQESMAVNTRIVKGTGKIRRRRECLNCRKRYTTYEGVILNN